MFRRLITAVLVPTVAAMILPLLGSVAYAQGGQTIGPGDIIGITVLGEPDLTKRVVVDMNGKISLPMINEVEVGGKTTTEAATAIRTKLKEFVKNPQVTVEITEAAQRMVVVSGAVKAPGVYKIETDTRLMGALTLAGGYTPDADLSKITVTRGGKTDVALTVDLTEFVSGVRPEANIVLSAGDTIVVPEKTPIEGSVFVLGEVNQRGPLPLRQGMTLRECLAAAGGVTQQADTSRITLKRKDQSESVRVDYAKLMAGDPIADIVLQVGDTIVVPAAETLGTFTILGPVARPGQYPVVGMMYITDALAAAGGTGPTGKLSDVRIRRTVGTKVQTLKADVQKITAGKTENVVVQPGDVILVAEKKPPIDTLRAAGILVSLMFLFRR